MNMDRQAVSRQALADFLHCNPDYDSIRHAMWDNTDLCARPEINERGDITIIAIGEQGPAYRTIMACDKSPVVLRQEIKDTMVELETILLEQLGER